MPPKTNVKKTAKKNAKHHDAAQEDMLNALVSAIEGKSSKDGMTKAQREALEQKSTNAIAKIQGGRAPYTPEQLREALVQQQEQQQRAIEEAQYVNVEVPLKPEQTAWHEAAPGKYIRYEQFKGSDEEMNFIVDLFTKELTEPYSSFTYQYFVFGWPDLCVTAYGVESATAPDASVVGERVGATVSRVSREGPGRPLRGYLAMFAVVPSFRGVRLGSSLVSLTVELMRAKDCDEVFLETPLSNERALSLYLRLGFAKTKFLPRYYLDHADAYRLKLWLKDPLPAKWRAAQEEHIHKVAGAAAHLGESAPAEAATEAANE
ncbi:peptide alpha-N-acetyltransferase [Strigomonas culicis]|uniref:Peptide alpha-N-acetyltransferase n=1 Tax=Strigomonas culicis TaxID=28005 RepID=S9VEI1_9TRYP|nr:peptide alpha-N-acetyltransferase [Strigomonas culicis]EPY30426.1 peptide alpha-N-acetyltransferase [Strigomonas culicis]|eukprot:EPY25506.1 peptide alpha-N-acetyltransferase [Strigomonas culicis]